MNRKGYGKQMRIAAEKICRDGEDLGTAVKRLVNQLGSQQAAADYLNIDRQLVNRWLMRFGFTTKTKRTVVRNR